MRYFIHLGYDGTRYSGWQRQINTPKTVQEVIENVLFKIFKKKIIVFGCGRTDAGVHASQYIIHINLEEAPDFDLQFRMNKNLPDDITIFEIIESEENQHAQFHAIARTYDYFMHWNDDPVIHRHSSNYGHLDFDFDKMREATAIIANTKDFRAVCKQPDLYKNTNCEIMNCELFINPEQGRLRFSITGNRFLRGMVRCCVYFLIEVGTHKMTLDDMQKIINLEKKSPDKQPAYPNGLFLSKVEYPFIQFKDSHQLIRMMKVGLE